jgi:pseudouridine-5'-phosphate glycosidase/pseudouridine kinase
MLKSFASNDVQFMPQLGIEKQTTSPELSTVGQAKITKVFPHTPESLADIVVAGALAVDYSCDYTPFSDSSVAPQLNTSNPARITQSLGGVAHNVAKAAHYLGANVKLLSVVGNDLDGRSAKEQLRAEEMRIDGIEICSETDARTARYIAINDTKKDLVMAMADMNLLNTHGERYLDEFWTPEIQREKPRWLVADANWEPRILHKMFTIATKAGCLTALEPVSVAKGARLFKRTPKSASTPIELPVFPANIVDLMTPNAMELAAMHTTARDEGLLEGQEWWKRIDEFGIPSSGIRSRLMDAASSQLAEKGIPQQAIQLLPFVPCIVTKIGPEGVLLTMLLQEGDPRLSSPDAAPYIISRPSSVSACGVAGVYMRLYPPFAKVADQEIISVNGVGDTFLGASLAYMIKTKDGIEHAIDFAQSCAVRSLQSSEAVSPSLRDKIKAELREGSSSKQPFYQLSGR